jgi:hypothetical protein
MGAPIMPHRMVLVNCGNCANREKHFGEQFSVPGSQFSVKPALCLSLIPRKRLTGLRLSICFAEN